MAGIPTLRGAPVLAAALLALAPGASAQWVVESRDGGSSIKLGFLAQPQAEWLEAPTGGQYAQNLARGRFTPFVQYASRDLAGPSPDEDSLQAGLAWWSASTGGPTPSSSRQPARGRPFEVVGGMVERAEASS